MRYFGFLKTFCLATLMLFCLTSISYAKQEIPQLKQPVMDLAHMLSPEVRNNLNQQLLDYDRSTGSQIVVLTIAALGNEEIFDYGTRIFDQWQLGRKGVDDGVLLLVARDDRKIHIFVGSGLEGAIPDAYAKRIISEIMTPQFREGNIDGGVTQAVDQLQKLIAGEQLSEVSQDNSDNFTSIIGLYIFFCIFGLPYYLKKIFGKLLGTVIFVGPSFALPFLFGISWPIAIVIAIAAFFASFLSPMSGSGGGGGFGGGRGGSGSGRSSRGGFSGGGGGFRGGGASGGW